MIRIIARFASLLLPLALTACTVETREEHTFGECQPISNAPELAYTELSIGGDFVSQQVNAVLTSQADLDAFTTAHDVTLSGSFDFATDQILVASTGALGTCGLSTPVVSVVDLNGVAHLELEVTDPSGACNEVCDMAASVTVAVAVSKGTDASVCTRLIATCE